LRRRTKKELEFIPKKRVCPICKKVFYTEYRSQRKIYCSYECYKKHDRLRQTKIQRIKWTIKYKYGIEYDKYTSLLQKQHYRCAICNKSLLGERIDLDHDHKTGKIRGILCHRCNMALGFFNDDLIAIKNAVNYLITTNLNNP